MTPEEILWVAGEARAVLSVLSVVFSVVGSSGLTQWPQPKSLELRLYFLSQRGLMEEEPAQWSRFENGLSQLRHPRAPGREHVTLAPDPAKPGFLDNTTPIAQ